MSVYIKIEQESFDEKAQKEFKELKNYFFERYEQADATLASGMSLRKRIMHDPRIADYPR